MLTSARLSLAAAAAVGIAVVVVRLRKRWRAEALPAGGDPWAALKDASLSELPVKDFAATVFRLQSPPEAVARALRFQPQPGDVITMTTPKTGQTWLLAQLRMLSLGKVADVAEDQLATKMSAQGDGVPWLEHAQSGCRSSVEASQPGSFRIFKSHLLLRQARAMVEEGRHARFITCLRAPPDVALSLFTHLRGVWANRCNNGDAGPFERAYTPSDFALAGLPEAYEPNLLEWLELRDRPNVLIMWYEEMVADPLSALRKLAAFVGVPLDAELEASVLQATSYDRMAASTAFRNVFPGGGTYGRGRAQLSPEAVGAVDARWQVVSDATGAATYEELYEKMHGDAAFPFGRS